MEEGANHAQITMVTEKLIECGFEVHRSIGERHIIIGAIGAKTVDPREYEILPGVRDVIRITAPYKLVSRHFNPEGTIIRIKDVEIGGTEVIVMAGPCSVESEEQIEAVAEHVARHGAKILRGGAFKPRTSPYSFQGLGEAGLKMLRRAADKYGLLVVSELMESSQIPMFLHYVDIIQVGARNMQNFSLLKDLGRIKAPILLKRGPAATFEETLLSAEYLLSGGNGEVIICERGIKTFETYTRNTLDISAIPVFKKLSHLPVVADPSHGTGRRDKVSPMARAALAAGADGLLIEVHNSPENALSDGAQSLYPEQFEQLMHQLSLIAPAINRQLGFPPFSQDVAAGVRQRQDQAVRR